MMGLLDVLNGMQNGPRGQRNPSPNASSGGGMSPITMAILGLLAYKAVKHFTNQPGAAPSTANQNAGPATAPGQIGGDLGGLLNSSLGGLLGGQGGGAGGLGNLLQGGLGGLLAGGAAGSVLSGGLNDLLGQLQQGGQGDVAKSWVSNEPNQAISPDDLASALGADRINALTAQTGMSREDLLAGLSEHLPEVVNQLTPHGRVPTEQEISI
ncbi:YidB family protein [Microbacteriaceae bacterium K1510]|nr:YidB family protein [Microbacteriaceae bacterium K1510]